MSCLMTFILCNLITVVMDVLLNRTIEMILNGFQEVFSTGGPTTTTKMAFFLYFTSVTASFTAQAIGCWQGWKAHQEARANGTEVVPGSWGAPDAGAGGGNRWQNYGGGRLGSGGGGEPNQYEMQDRPPQQAQNQGQGFQAFSGT